MMKTILEYIVKNKVKKTNISLYNQCSIDDIRKSEQNYVYIEFNKKRIIIRINGDNDYTDKELEDIIEILNKILNDNENKCPKFDTILLNKYNKSNKIIFFEGGTLLIFLKYKEVWTFTNPDTFKDYKKFTSGYTILF